MKVVVDATTLDGLPSGAATRCAALGAALQRRGVDLLHLVRPGLAPLPGLPCRDFATRPTPLGRVRAGRRLDALLAAEGADLFLAAALPLAALGACPQWLTLHDLRFLHAASGPSLPRRLWSRHLLRPNLARAAGVVAVSESTASELRARELLSGQRLVVAPNAPTPGLARVEDPARLAAFRRRAGLNCRYALAIGPLVRHKQVDQALQLVAQARRHAEGADLGLVLAGRAAPREALALARRGAELGLGSALSIVGVLDAPDLAAALSGADALLVLGRSEGFSIPLVDAQALAVPVVAVDAGALSEVAGDGAWLVPPDDLPGLLAALLDAVTPSDLREARLRHGLALAARWSWERSAELLHAAWRAALGR